MHNRILNDVLAAQEQTKKTKSGLAQANLWRTVMKSPLTKLATAAIVAIACLIGLSLWRGTESGIALADVLAQIDKVKAFRYNWSVKITIEDPNNPYNFEARATELISQEYGSITKVPDPNGGESIVQETYFLPQKNVRIEIIPKQKKYSRAELDDTQVKQELKRLDKNDPREYLKGILKTKYESLGRSTIDGIEVEGFRSTDPNMLIGRGRSQNIQFDVKLWVDVKTLLPVRFEYEHFIQMGDNKKDHTRIVFYDFQWDVPLDASEFEPVIPDGYTVTVIKLPPNNEETAIQGLKQCVELFGKYPERVTDIYQRVKLLLSGNRGDTLPAERLLEEIKGLTEDEIRNKLLMPIRGLERFACGLMWDKKDPAYYGKTVTPKDMDKVLMRWKVSDNQYRAIFGDLRAETVTPEKLAELEAALPK
jgi:hypothetical protein